MVTGSLFVNSGISETNVIPPRRNTTARNMIIQHAGLTTGKTSQNISIDTFGRVYLPDNEDGRRHFLIFLDLSRFEHLKRATERRRKR